MKAADEGRDTLLSACDGKEWYLRGPCRAAAYTAHTIATGAAATSYGIATAAITGVIASFEIGRFARCQIEYELAKSTCENNNENCKSNS